MEPPNQIFEILVSLLTGAPDSWHAKNTLKRLSLRRSKNLLNSFFLLNSREILIGMTQFVEYHPRLAKRNRLGQLLTHFQEFQRFDFGTGFAVFPLISAFVFPFFYRAENDG